MNIHKSKSSNSAIKNDIPGPPPLSRKSIPTSKQKKTMPPPGAGRVRNRSATDRLKASTPSPAASKKSGDKGNAASVAKSKKSASADPLAETMAHCSQNLSPKARSALKRLQNEKSGRDSDNEEEEEEAEVEGEESEPSEATSADDDESFETKMDEDQEGEEDEEEEEVLAAGAAKLKASSASSKVHITLA